MSGRVKFKDFSRAFKDFSRAFKDFSRAFKDMYQKIQGLQKDFSPVRNQKK
jgi:hypothetical protein